MDNLDPVFSAVASYFAVLAEPTRLKIMHTICEGERTVSQIVDHTRIRQSNVSRHLGLMRRHGIVARRRDGNQVHYQIADETMLELCRAACARIAKTIDERHALRSELLTLMRAPQGGRGLVPQGRAV